MTSKQYVEGTKGFRKERKAWTRSKGVSGMAKER